MGTSRRLPHFEEKCYFPPASSVNSPDLQSLKDARSDNTENQIIGFLNINSLWNKIIDLRGVLKHTSLDYFVLSETKLDNSFPCVQSQISDYEIRARRDQNKYGGGLIDFAKKGLICKRLKTFETVNNECICSELTVSKKMWVCFSVYRPPSRENLELFFEERTSCLSKAGETYENFIVMGDFNIDIRTKGREYEKFEDFCSLFNLSNLIKTETCFSKNHKSTIDLFTANKPNIFQHMNITETGLSDFHKMIGTFFKATITWLKPRKIYYRNYKNFGKSSFLLDLKSTNLDSSSIDPDENYIFLTNQFLKVVNQHVPLKVKTLRGNHAPFVDKQLRK